MAVLNATRCAVAKGYTEIEGVDFHETLAPVAKIFAVRCLLAVAVVQNWELQTSKMLFYMETCIKEVYMKIPQGYAK